MIGNALSGGHGDLALAVLTGEPMGLIEMSISGGTIRDELESRGIFSSDEPGAQEVKKEISERITSERKQAIKYMALDCVAHGRMMTFGTLQVPSDAWRARNRGQTGVSHSGGELKLGGIAHKHVYEVVTADQDTITIRNPWQQYGRVRGLIVEDAISVLSWEEAFEVLSNFGFLR